MSKVCIKCGKVLRSSKHDLCYECRQKLNKKPDHYCSICNKKISSCSKSFDISGAWLCTQHFNEWKQHNKYCSMCNKSHTFFSNTRQKVCDSCLESPDIFKLSLELAYNLSIDLQKKLLNNTDIFKWIYNKLINKSGTLRDFNITCKKYSDLYKKIIDKISRSLNTYISVWTEDDNDIFIECLLNAAAGNNGYIVKTSTIDFSKPIIINWKDTLFGWFSTWENADIAFKILYNFKLTDKSGKGEFLYTLLFDNVIPNSQNIADILTEDNKLYEMKDATCEVTAGRFLINRNNWVSIIPNNFEKYKTLLKSFFLMSEFFVNYNIEAKNILNIIDNTDIINFSWQGLYKNLLTQIYTIDKNYTKEFIFFIHTNFIFNIEDKNISFKYNLIDFNIENKDEIEAFALVNQLKYYFEIDAKDENLSGLIAISAFGTVILSREFICQTCTMSEILDMMKYLKLAWPSTELTKEEKHHDRNKNRASGVYLIKNI